MDNNVSKQKQIELGEGVSFVYLRRITGYITGDMDSWNDAKKAEEADRVKHTL